MIHPNDSRWKTAFHYDPTDTPDGPNYQEIVGKGAESLKDDVLNVLYDAIRDALRKASVSFDEMDDYMSENGLPRGRSRAQFDHVLAQFQEKLSELDDVVAEYVLTEFEKVQDAIKDFPTY